MRDFEGLGKTADFRQAIVLQNQFGINRGTTTVGKDSDKPEKSSLTEWINQLEADLAPSEQRPNRAAMPAEGLALAGRIATELVAGVALGSFVGWMLDRWLGTTPGFMLGLFFLGAVAGMMNVWRLMTGRDMAAGYFKERKADQKAADKDRSK